MFVDIVTAGILAKPDLKQSSRKDGSTGSLQTFDDILSLTITNASTEQARIDAAKAGKVVEMMHLEMLRDSLTLGEMTGEPPPSTIDKTLCLLLQDTAKVESQSAERISTTGTIEVLKSRKEPTQAIDAIIDKASNRYDIDPELIRAVIKAESNFNPRAVSHSGAQGLMQLMPSTARGLGVTDSFDPEQNIMAGTRFLKQMLNRYGGDLNAALAAYNWGPGNVDKGMTSLPKETREYLVRVKGFYSDYLA